MAFTPRGPTPLFSPMFAPVLAALAAAACAQQTTAGAPAAEAGEASEDVCVLVSGAAPDAPALEDASTYSGRVAAAAARAQAWMDENAARDDVVVRESGLQYRVLASGPEGGRHPISGELVCVHYRGVLVDGTEFDSSCARGAAAAFPSDRLIEGWVEALPLMSEGDVWELHIPPALGYGVRGAGGDIGPNEALVFRMALLGVLDEPVGRDVDCASLFSGDAE